MDFTEGLSQEICRLGASKVLEDMVIALDPSDIRKEHARAMEYLCRIRDESENELAQALACPFKATLIKYKGGKEKVRTVCYSAVSVKLPGRDE